MGDYGYGGGYMGGPPSHMQHGGRGGRPGGRGNHRGGGGGGFDPHYGGGGFPGYGPPGYAPGPYGEPPGFPPDPYIAQSPLDAEIQVVVHEIHNEINLLEQSGDYGAQFRNAKRLLTTEADRLENCIDPEWLEVDIQKPIKVTKKVLIPNFRHPHFNFVGKVIGPKGATLQNLAKEFKSHIYVLGRGSTKDRNKEKELLESGDPQFAHYGGPLHVKIETIAPAPVAYERVAGILNRLQQLLQPIRGDDYPGDPGSSTGGEKEDEPNGDGGDINSQRKEGSGGRGGRGNYRGGGRGGPPRGGGPMRGAPRGRGGQGYRPY